MEALVDGAILEYVLKTDIDDRPVFSNETNRPSNITAHGVTTEAVLVPIAMGLVFLLGVLGNLTLMHVVARFTAMRHNAVYVYATNIAVAHFLTLMAAVPFSALTYTLPEWPFGEVICKVGKFMITVSSAVSVLSLAALSVDRYCALTCESRCVGGTSCTNTTLALILVWFLAISVAIPDFVSAFIMVLPNAYRPGETVKVCFPYPETWGRDYPKIQTLVKGTLIFALPMFVSLLFGLIVAVQLASKRMKRTKAKVTPEPTTDTASMDEIYSTPARTKRPPEDTSDNDSEDSLSEETKQRFIESLKLIFLLLLTFAACWLPYYVYWLLFFYSRWQLVGTDYQEPYRVIVFCLTLFSNSINPYVLCASDGTFRACFGRSLACSEKKRRRKKRRQKKSRTRQSREKTRKIPHFEEPAKSRRRRAPTQRRSRGRPYLYMDRYLNDYSAPHVASDDHYFVGTRKPSTINDHQYSTLPAKLSGSPDNSRDNYIPYPAQGLGYTDTGSYDDGIHWTGRSDPLSGVDKSRRQPIYEPTDSANFWEPVDDYAPAYKTIEKYRRCNMSDIKEESNDRVPSPTVSDSPSIQKPKGVYV